MKNPSTPNESSEFTDEELMSQVASGDEDAFALLVRRYQNLIYGTVVKMLGNDMEAEDVAQQIFLRVYKAAGKYRKTAKFTTWLLTICRNCVFTHLKQRKKHESLDDAEEKPEIEDSQASTSSDNLLNAELEQVIQKSLNDLPENQRLAVVLQQYDDLDYEQIAEVLGASVASVKSLLFRARETLRAILQKYLTATYP